MGKRARASAAVLAQASSAKKSEALRAMAAALRAHKDDILEANGRDMRGGEENGLGQAMLERLKLTEQRIEDMAVGIEEVAALPDPIGQTVRGYVNSDGLEIAQVRVPLGVIGVIYESRPNVTADTAALCLKSGNAVILRGGSEAMDSSRVIVSALIEAVSSAGLPEGCIQLLDVPGHEATTALM
ncbi:MAG: aldehyde dehydrogenase family protein, partial [Pyramidobacter porci]|nr:aldehyde dehydrogenase family protein [Pyramidobacter porci]